MRRLYRVKLASRTRTGSMRNLKEEGRRKRDFGLFRLARRFFVFFRAKVRRNSKKAVLQRVTDSREYLRDGVAHAFLRGLCQRVEDVLRVLSQSGGRGEQP